MRGVFRNGAFNCGDGQAGERIEETWAVFAEVGGKLVSVQFSEKLADLLDVGPGGGLGGCGVEPVLF